MTDVVKQLRAEHAGMSRLLDMLEQQVEQIERAGDPDYGLIEDIVAYFLDFPDQCHHPKEDVLAARLLELAPQQAGPLQGLAEKHRELGAMSHRVAAIIGAVVNEQLVSRADVARTAREFIDSQRLHIEMEDAHFLPLVEELLPYEERANMEEDVFGTDDPLHHAQTSERFARLRQSLMHRW